MTASASEAGAGPIRRIRRIRRWSVALAVVVALSSAACVSPPTEDAAGTTATTETKPTVDPRAYTVRIRATSCEGVGVGSGFLLDSHTIVTNRHVVEGAEKLAVETYLGDELTVDVASQGGLADLAVVKVEKGIGQNAHLAPADPSAGTQIRAYGYPKGGPMKITRGTVDDYVSDIRLGNLGKVMRSDVDIQPGNSGGPVLDDRDRVVGVVYAIERKTDLSLIVPVSTLADLLDDEKNLEPVEGC